MEEINYQSWKITNKSYSSFIIDFLFMNKMCLTGTNCFSSNVYIINSTISYIMTLTVTASSVPGPLDHT